MIKNLKQQILPIIKLALKEDLGSGDITTRLTVAPKKQVRAEIIAKQNGIVCGLDVAKLVFKTTDKRIRVKPKTSDGRQVKKGKVIMRLEGRAHSILAAERVALNFLSHLSGIATLTNQYVRKAKPYRAKIMDTRKTTPGMRTLEKYAVRCGGGTNHRLGLWDQILIKDNHVYVYRNGVLTALIKKANQKRPKGMKVEAEVRNLLEFKEALKAGPDIIMLDNFSISNIRKAVKIKKHSPLTTCNSLKLEASGGISLKNVRRVAATGVDRIAIGELTHSAGALDIALNCEYIPIS